MSLASVRAANSFPVYEITDPRFARYGRILRGYDTAALAALADRTTVIDSEKNAYVASVPEFEAEPVVAVLADAVYGGMSVQAGYCNGPNSKMNAVEYHKSPEIFIAVTDSVQILGLLSDVDGFRSYDTAKAEVFFFPAGSVVECYPGTLHFSPCKTEAGGFKSIIILPRGTNTPAPEHSPHAEDPETRLLFMKNKWLIAHKERTPLVEKGAWPGLNGTNIEIRI